MNEVSQFEAHLIRILRCILERSPVEQMLAVILREQRKPRCLSRSCVELVKSSLATGVPLFLAREDWHVSRFLRDERVLEGRLWQRTNAEHLQLNYSRNTMDLLIWLTAENFAKPAAIPKFELDTCSIGDSVLHCLVVEKLRDTSVLPTLLKIPALAENPLIRLTHPEVFATPEPAKIDFDPWFTPQRSWVLEALQQRLCTRWIQIESTKRRMTSHEDLEAVGTAQRSVLDSFLDSAERHNRRDLTRFVMTTARELLRLATPDSKRDWFEQVNVGDLRIADRQRVYDSGLALLRSLDRLSKWNQSARIVSFYDENYEASQLWKSDWEQIDGDSVCLRAREVVQSIAEFRV